MFVSGRRRRSSLFQSLTSLASVALVSAMGSATNLEKDNVSGSDSDGDDQKDLDDKIDVRNNKAVSREDSVESGVLSFSVSPESEAPSTGHANKAFEFDDETISKLECRDSVSWDFDDIILLPLKKRQPAH